VLPARPAQIQSLTALRGVAATVVLIYHGATLVSDAPSSSVPGGFSRGYLAVDLFFLLSGFVLMHVYGGSFAGSPWRGYGAFLWLRLARIYPVHLAMIALLLPLYGLSEAFSGKALVLNLLLLAGPWMDYGSWNIFSWTISAEWHAYLVFPLIACGLARAPRASLVRLGALSLLVIAWLDIHFGAINVTNGPALLLRVLPEFLAGTILYRVFVDGRARSIIGSDTALAFILLAIVACAILKAPDSVIVALLSVLLLSCAYNVGGFADILSSRPLTFVGRISYSLYMVQAISALAFVGMRHKLESFGASDPIMVLGFLVASFVFAAIVSRLIEYPARTALRNLHRRARGFPLLVE